MKKLHQLIAQIRQLWVCIGITALFFGSVSAQNITRIEYFYDTDPGFGNGTAVSFTQAANVSALNFTASIASLSYGFHTFYVRSKDANNKWSLTNQHSFVKYQTPSGPSAAGNIVKLEYFVDTDPGFGLGTNVPVTSSPDIANQSFSVNLNALSYGFHTIYVRSKDANGKWAITGHGVFIRYNAPSGPPTVGNIVKMEYFIDTDPGFGLASNVPVTAAADIPNTVFPVSLAAINSGFHTLYVRTKDSNGKWAITGHSAFIKYTAPTGHPAATPVVKVEYFIDADPGFGQGTSIPVVAANDIPGTVSSVNISSLSTGFHTFYIRSMDSTGKWSITNNSPFIKYQAPTGPAAAGRVVKLEYFIDTDPGFGGGVGLPFVHATNVSNLVSSINLTTVPPGFHTFYIRSMDTLSKWSITNHSSFSGGTDTLRPVAVIHSNGPDTFCLGAGTYLYADYAFASTYRWQLNNVNITGATNTYYTPTQTGNYRFIVTNSIGSDTSVTIHVVVYPVPTAAISAGGALTFCQGGSVTLSVNSTANASYQWKLNGSNVGTNSTSYVANQSGVYYVDVSVPGGCSATSSNDTVTVNSLPSATITAGGSTTFCTGDSVTLTAAANLTYHWSTGATTRSIKVYTSSTLNLTVTNINNCSATASPVTVTVVGPPTATITPNGGTTFCNGGNVILQASAGGTAYLWSTGATTTSITVTVTGSYVVTVSNSGCSRVSTPIGVTVNPGPSVTASASTPTICAGASDTLTANGATTYSWSPATGLNSTTLATVISTPTASITYTVTGTTGGCIGTASVTVNINPNHATVGTTTPNICANAAAVLNANGASTYAWSPSTYLNQTTGASVTSTPANTITYTVTGTTGACSSTATVTVNVTQPVVPSVTVTVARASICAAATDTFTSTAVNGGNAPSYTWYKNGVLQSGSTATLILSSLANNDSVWCLMTSNAACSVPSSATGNKIIMVVNPVVTPTIGLTVSHNPICVGDSIVFTANITNGGTTPVYQWKKNNVTVGGNSASYTVYSPNNNDSVWCILTSNVICASSTVVTSSKIKIVVNPIVTPTVTVTPSQNPICANTSVTFNASVTGAGTSPSYQWYKNGGAVGINSNAYSDNGLANNDSVWCVLTSNATCASTNTVTSSKVIIVVASNVVPSVSVSAQSTICAGTPVTFTATPINGGSAPNYQWYKNGALQSGNTNQYSSSVLANNDSVWCVMTSNATCPVPTTAISNKTIMIVNPIVVPTISITSTLSTICAGDSVTFTASITNGGVVPTYQWKKNGLNVGGNSAIFGTSGLANNDSVWCVLTSTAACPSPASVTSNKLRFIVNAIVTPTATVTATQTTICVGTNVTFTAHTVNGGTNPSYQWYLNGAAVGTNQVTYANNSLGNNDSVWCVVTSHAVCTTTGTATSNKVIITITTTVVPSVSVTGSQTTICLGTPVTFTASPINGGTSPSYQWYKNGTLQAGNTVTFSPATLANNDSVWCILTSNANCVSPTTATSNKVYITVNPIVTPTISVSVSNNPICAGDSVTFTATITNGGSSPSYQWKRNGSNVGSNSAIFGITGLANNDSVWCVLTSNVTCPSTVSVTSSKVRMTVNPIVTPTISVTATQTTICIGTNVTFTAHPVNGGTSPVYHWYKNGNTVGTNLVTYADNGLANNDSVWCIITSNAVCPSTANATSNKVIITITTTVVATVSISATQTTICAGTPVTFTASPVNGGSSPTYQWYKNGTLQVGNTVTFSPATLANNDSVWCVLTSNANCVSPTTATSNKVYMTVITNVVPTVSITANQSTICAGDSIVLTAHVTNGGTNTLYSWIVDGASTGSSGITYTMHAPANSDSVWCAITSNATCATPPNAVSTKVHVTVNPIVNASVTISASQNPICSGTQVTFTAIPANGGTSPQYLWYKNGTVTGNNAITYSDGSLAAGDSVWCQLTSNANCVGLTTAISNHVVIGVTATVVPSVTIAAIPGTSVCLGTVVSFTATPVNGGTLPGYKWYVNGVAKLTGASAFFTDTTAGIHDSVWCIMQSSAQCPSQNKDTSNIIDITIRQPAVYNYSQSICSGGSYSFNGRTLTQPGTYRDTLTGINTCDSFVVLQLAVNPVLRTYLRDSVCQGYTFNFNGHVLDTAGVYVDTLLAATTCDSIVTLNLTIKNHSFVSDSAAICQGDIYVFHNNPLVQQGIYRDTLVAANGCDSVTRLVLVVHPKPVPVVIQSGTDTLKTNLFGKYQWYLNGQILSGDTFNVYVAAQNGPYTVFAIDSFGCGDTSVVYHLTTVGIENTALLNLLVYPNPADGLIHVNADNLPCSSWLEVRDDLGRLIVEMHLNAGPLRQEVDLSKYSSGIYLLVIKDESGILAARRVVKN